MVHFFREPSLDVFQFCKERLFVIFLLFEADHERILLDASVIKLERVVGDNLELFLLIFVVLVLVSLFYEPALLL